MPGYDPEQVISTWAAIPIQGPMAGTFFEAEHRSKSVSLEVGAQGRATYVENPDKTGTIKITLDPTSPTNALLSAAHAARLMGTWLMKQLDQVTTLVEGQDSRIEMHAPIKRGDKLIGMEWTFLVGKLLLVAGGDSP